MDTDHQKSLNKLAKLLAKGKIDKAVRLSGKLAEAYMAQSLYLRAVDIWKRVLNADPSRVEAHLWLIALQEQLQLDTDAQIQRRILEDVCKRQNISAAQLLNMKSKLGLKNKIRS